jgi:hypothetical protein
MKDRTAKETETLKLQDGIEDDNKKYVKGKKKRGAKKRKKIWLIPDKYGHILLGKET